MAAHEIVFEALQSAFQNLGAEHEGAVFAELECLPWVVRAAEFARVDGALLTQGTLSTNPSYADKMWALAERARAGQSPELVLLDVKSRVSGDAHDQIYITTVGQRARTAVFVGVCAANPDFVEVIPNPHGGRATDKDDGCHVAVNISRRSLLPASAYGHLSPCNSAARMPVRYLGEALRRVAACARGEGDYVNPWTLVRFAGWRPLTVRTNEDLLPDSRTQHFTAFRSMMEIFRCVRNARRWNDPLPLSFEMLYMQPRVADFKFIVDDVRTGTGRQVFVQHKIDGQDRSRDAKLVNVAIARGREDGTWMWYFTPFERFDFFFYQFDYRNRATGVPTSEFFFVPERHIPDLFYTTMEKTGDFEAIDQRYRIAMDPEGCWVERVYQIIVDNPSPRAGSRPLRDDPGCYERQSRTPARQPRYRRMLLPRVLDWIYAKFFAIIMAQCAAQLSGLLVVLSRDHPMGDFAYCRYAWTEQERDAFLSDGAPPCCLHDLPASAVAVPLYVFARDREGTSRGPSLTSTEFRRVNSTAQSRLLVFDMFGEEGRTLFCPLLVVPSEDMSLTDDQREQHEKNLALDRANEYGGRVSSLAEQLHTGCLVSDYNVGSGGPLAYEQEGEWMAVWALLERFAGLTPFAHPPGHQRRPESFQVTVRNLHQSLCDEQSQIGSYERFLEEADTE